MFNFSHLLFMFVGWLISELCNWRNWKKYNAGIDIGVDLRDWKNNRSGSEYREIRSTRTRTIPKVVK